MEYTLSDGTPINKSVVIERTDGEGVKSNITYSKQSFADLASNGDILEVAATPSPAASKTLDWGSGSVVGGKWQRWTLRDKTDAELLAEVRGKRTRLLSETDYFALSDVTMSSDMTTYRQKLRDLPATVDLTDIVYPTKP
jgi:hypothetical protein